MVGRSEIEAYPKEKPMSFIILGAIAATAIFSLVATANVVARDGYRAIPSRTA